MTWAGESTGGQSGIYIVADDGSPLILVGPSEGGVPYWNNDNQTWDFRDQTALTGVAPTKLSQIEDVDVTTPVQEDVLKWNGSSWTPSSIFALGQDNSYFSEANGTLIDTSSTSFVDVPQMSGTLTTNIDAKIYAEISFEADSGAGGGETLEVRLIIDGETVQNTGIPLQRDLSGASDIGIGGLRLQSDIIPSGEDATARFQVRSVGGSNVVVQAAHFYMRVEEGITGPTGPQGAQGDIGPSPNLDTIAAIWLYTTASSGAGFPTSPTDLYWDEAHEITKPLELNRDETNFSRINIYSSGLYAISYSMEGEQSAQLVNIAAYINGVEHSGTRTTGGEYHHPQAHEYFINRQFLHEFASGDYLQIKFWESSTDSATIDANANLMVWRLEGYQGPQGVAGADGADGLNGSGDLTGPGTSTPRAIAVFEDSGGKNIAEVQIIVGESGHMHNAKTYTFETEFDNGNSGASATINWNESQKQQITLSAATPALTFVGPSGVGNFLLRTVQDATGGRVPSWPSTVKWAGGTAPDFASSTGNQVDIATFYYSGEQYYGVASLDFF